MKKISSILFVALIAIVIASVSGINPLLIAGGLMLASFIPQAGVLATNLLDPAIILEARAKMMESGQRFFEDRPTNSHILDAFLISRDYMITQSEIDKIKSSNQRPVKIESWKKQNINLFDHKSETPTGITLATAITELTFAPISATMFIDYKELLNNDFNSQVEHIARILRTLERSIIVDGAAGSPNGTTSLEDQLLAFLEANRTHVSALSSGTHKNTWKGTPDFLTEVSLANRARFWNLLKFDLLQNNYSEELIHIFNTEFGADWEAYRAQGSQNGTNTQYQFNGHTAINSNKIVNGKSYYDATDYVIAKGGVGIVSWNENNRLPFTNYAGQYEYREHAFTMLTPIFGRVPFTADLLLYQTVANTVATGGGRQSPVLAMEMTLNTSIFKAPLSVSGETPIFKYAQLNA